MDTHADAKTRLWGHPGEPLHSQNRACPRWEPVHIMRESLGTLPESRCDSLTEHIQQPKGVPEINLDLENSGKEGWLCYRKGNEKWGREMTDPRSPICKGPSPG